MNKENSKFNELIKNMETLDSTKKGKLKGGITVLKKPLSNSLLDASNYGVCTGTGDHDNNYGVCISKN